MIKKLLLVILILLCALCFWAISAMDKRYFISPITYSGDLMVRSDGRGDGTFASMRSGHRIHKGLDLLAELGQNVYAAKSGRVVAATQNRGMGKYIIIRHRDNIISIYGHLSNIFVQRLQHVRQGQLIGSVGKTGNARAAGMLPHLHFEIRKGGIPQDPLEYL